MLINNIKANYLSHLKNAKSIFKLKIVLVKVLLNGNYKESSGNVSGIQGGSWVCSVST